MKNSVVIIVLCLFFYCCDAQNCLEKSIYTVKLFPPYSECDVQNLTKIISNGSEVFILLPVKEGKNGKGYLLKSSRFLEKYWDEHAVAMELKKMPYAADSIRLELYDFGIIWDFNLERFLKETTCDIVNMYFDKNGNVKQLGNLSPIPFVIAELTRRDVKIFLNDKGDFMLDVERYCP